MHESTHAAEMFTLHLYTSIRAISGYCEIQINIQQRCIRILQFAESHTNVSSKAYDVCIFTVFNEYFQNW